jgi:transcriptional regulator with XRE-family HTH domain
MSLRGAASEAGVPLLAYVKEQSGRRIEDARKRKGITQRVLARELGMGVRWLREIESGNPRSRLDDHLRCTYELEISTGHILIPLLYAGQNMAWPQQLIAGDLRELERRCIEMISEENIRRLTNQLTPSWRTPPAPVAAG